MYWFGFPAISSVSIERIGSYQPLSEHFSRLDKLDDTFNRSKEILAEGFFVVHQASEQPILKTLESLKEAETDINNVIFGFLDPSSVEDPGWILRNYITFIVKKL